MDRRHEHGRADRVAVGERLNGTDRRIPPAVSWNAARLFMAALALFDQTGTQPPNHGVKPKHGFDRHMNRGGDIIAAANVA